MRPLISTGFFMTVTPKQLAALMAGGRSVVVVDVREPWEYEINHIEGATLIPLDELPKRVNELSTADDIVVNCLSGQEVHPGHALPQQHGLQEGKEPEGRDEGLGLQGPPRAADILDDVKRSSWSSKRQPSGYL